MAQSNAIAIGSGNLIYGASTIRKIEKPLTQVCINDALEMCAFYKGNRSFKFTDEDYAEMEKKILSANSDDEISGIMCRLRHKMFELL